MTKIFVISHQPIDFKLNSPYIPLYVGHAGETKDSLNDRDGDNISSKNPYFCELTAQYWVWKNLLPQYSADQLIGFCHYRRFFSPQKKIDHIHQTSEIDLNYLNELLAPGKFEVILSERASFPIKQHWFSISKRLGKIKFPWQNLSLLEQYQLQHNMEDLLLAISLLPEEHQNKFSEYLTGSSFSTFNMMLSNSGTIAKYFDVLFPWLFELENKIDLSTRTPYQARLFGFISERFCSYYFDSFHRPVYVPVSFLK